MKKEGQESEMFFRIAFLILGAILMIYGTIKLGMERSMKFTRDGIIALIGYVMISVIYPIIYYYTG